MRNGKQFVKKDTDVLLLKDEKFYHNNIGRKGVLSTLGEIIAVFATKTEKTRSSLRPFTFERVQSTPQQYRLFTIPVQELTREVGRGALLWGKEVFYDRTVLVTIKCALTTTNPHRCAARKDYVVAFLHSKQIKDLRGLDFSRCTNPTCGEKRKGLVTGDCVTIGPLTPFSQRDDWIILKGTVRVLM
ncbi:hypothetical protein NPIL_451751 [Nephila pilipes]|uniref:Uncharacterized protein n=1 Tax=Nephila pilipes TaxID=299642 RepID=A0A8X6TFA5_NEPPI|nr:hypothetical protein NPIL_451751 [Nephila pilipes]